MRRNLEELGNAVEAIEDRLTGVDGKRVAWQVARDDEAAAQAAKDAAKKA